MAGVSNSSSSSAQAPTASKNPLPWAEVVPSIVPAEDALSPAEVHDIWERMYKTVVRGSVNTEMERAAFRLAVYAYAAKNGTSREGDYTGTLILSNGAQVNAASIPVVIGKMKIRKFFRGCMPESYEALSKSRVMEKDPRFVMRASKLGISADAAFAMADWFSDCPSFTPAEIRAHDAAQAYGLTRAKNARSGHTLEQVEVQRLDKGLEAGTSLDPREFASSNMF